MEVFSQHRSSGARLARDYHRPRFAHGRAAREVDTMQTRTADRIYSLADGEGQAYWFVGALLQRKAGGAETEGRFATLDQTMPPDYAVPRHIHVEDDEAWYVLEGSMTFYCGERLIGAAER